MWGFALLKIRFTKGVGNNITVKILCTVSANIYVCKLKDYVLILFCIYIDIIMYGKVEYIWDDEYSFWWCVLRTTSTSIPGVKSRGCLFVVLWVLVTALYIAINTLLKKLCV